MKCALFSILGLSIALSTGFPISTGAEANDKRAAALLQLMAETYAEARSYSDTSTAIYRNPDGSDRLHVAFNIWFARPSDFRIDAESRSANSTAVRREVMWSSGAAARAWSTGQPVTTQAHIKLIGSRMFGTYAYHIPTLLDESYGGARRLHELTTPSFVGEETIEGVKCYHLRGSWEGDAYEVWLGAVDNLVRKITANYHDHQLEEMHRNISFDQEIPKEVFRFSPEEEKPSTPAGRK